uniref:Uncharacterized protein n=1 Tax=Globodera pallida TaxID=36090 RepID=A0A183CLK1_GLOPA
MIATVMDVLTDGQNTSPRVGLDEHTAAGRLCPWVLIRLWQKQILISGKSRQQALTILRPLKKVKRNELDSNEKPLDSAKMKRRGKREGPKAQPFGRDWNESDWNMKLRVEPRVRNVTEASVNEHGGLAAANAADPSNFDSRKTEVKRSAVDGNRRKENLSMSPEENNAPNMVPKPWW